MIIQDFSQDFIHLYTDLLASIQFNELIWNIKWNLYILQIAFIQANWIP